MTDSTYPDLASVEDWLNAKGYTGEAGACHAAMSLIRRQEARIAELERELSERPVVALLSDIARIAALEAALRPFAAIADDSTANLADNYMYPDCYPMSAFRAAKAALEKSNV